MFNFHRIPIRRGIIILVATISISALYILYMLLDKEFFTSESIACYRIKENSLPDISDASPTKGKSIFFHETSCSSFLNGKIQISSRQACAVESAARLNPNYDVYLLYVSPGIIKFEGTESDRFLKALLTYNNLKINHLDYEKYTKDTPVEKLYSSETVEKSKYSRSHASDVLRYLTLWKYGGIYLDLDVIVIKSLEDLHPNYAGLESDRNVAAGILNLAPTGKGHKWAQLCLEDLRDHFRGDVWGYNGPGVITRLLQKVCKTQKAKQMLKQKCQGFTVYPPEAFYAVPWWDWSMYFDHKYNDIIANMSRNSYIIHVWNKHSINTKVNIKSDVPYSKYAKEYCPKVFAECNEFF